MNIYTEKTEEGKQLYAALKAEYEAICKKGLKLDMSRGKPGSEQLDLSMDMLDVVNSHSDMKTLNGTDVRNYGILDGIPEAKELFAALLGAKPEEVIVGGNSTLTFMYDTIARGMLHGFADSVKPWVQCGKLKFLCPAPGYDRHFAICEHFGIEMIPIEMREDGPDMDTIEQIVGSDASVKGIWCVPKYSNPQGITYSDKVVTRFAKLKTAAPDFKIFWDNAYCVHHLTESGDEILDLLEEAKKYGTQDHVFMFTSTSKITFPGAGVTAMAASVHNIEYLKKLMDVQMISSDKINQLRHVRYFKDLDGIKTHMKRHAAILKPKFDMVTGTLQKELGGLGIAKWTTPKGGYFVSVDTLEGCARRTIELCANAGVKLTEAGATYPYHEDPKDTNIRLAPTLPPVKELKITISLFCLCVKLAALERVFVQ
ncbi:MAG TPA: aminotransferase class I/II-fold pyridoxal phosphate-dependent enzyme [Firmicutes bacterium]|nr:aminotransferase class I/II-fold pyridoxal phosphate-dependent enzyme [Bacillota bacterium]